MENKQDNSFGPPTHKVRINLVLNPKHTQCDIIWNEDKYVKFVIYIYSNGCIPIIIFFCTTTYYL